MNKPGGFWPKWKGKIIATIITVAVPAVPYGLLWAHDAYADGRYVGKEVFQQAIAGAEIREMKSDIKALDREIWKMQQETLLTDNEKEKAKYKMYEAFFEREKTAIKDEIKAMQTPKDG